MLDGMTGTATRLLSRPISRLRPHYDVVVVGSGYGGAIVADRLAHAGRSVCILEQGRELHPGQYPNTLPGALAAFQTHTPVGSVGSATALFDLHLDRDLSVLVGRGLGGTSLINANVALRPSRAIFADQAWPRELRADGALDAYYRRAEHMLGSNPYPDDHPPLAKLAGLERIAASVGGTVRRPNLNITFRDGPNAAGIDQKHCIGCGDCVTGCNHNAKNSVLMNYLPDAHRHGAEIFTEAAVRTVRRRDGGGWSVSFAFLGAGRSRFGGPAQFVTADVVVLAAGALGSTEILLRSAREGLAVSDRLGERFSGNGDVLAFAYNTGAAIHGIGSGRRGAHASTPVGPCIAGVVEVDEPGMAVEEGALPGALAAVLPAAFWAAAVLFGRDGGRRLPGLARRLRELASLPLGAYRGALDRTMTYLLMSSDDSAGRLVLAKDRVEVDWPDVGDRPVFQQDNDILRAATEKISGTYLPNPIWSTPLGHSLITVHPLGGCVMADNARHGVVNHKGQVFAGPTGTAVHEGLYVADGSVVPRALDANPLLTISALAERTGELIAADRGWTADARQPVSPAGERPGPRLRFTERMAGFLAPGAEDDFEGGYRRGRADGTPVEFVVTIDYPDLDACLADPATPAAVSGTVRAPGLSPRAMTVLDGEFILKRPAPERVETWHMSYRLPLVADDGTRFLLTGVKILRKRPGWQAWPETTTLYVTASDNDGRRLGVGVMRIAASDFARQLSTIEVLGAPGNAARLRYTASFGRMFGGALFRLYGGPLDEAARFPDAPGTPVPARPGRRDLPGKPEVRWCGEGGHWHEGGGADGGEGADAWLRLTRFRGGQKGPVLLASGFGMSTSAFLADTIETNLTEYLYRHGYDVWLFDYRAAIDLPSARSQFTIDDIARYDWPAAIDEVRRVTGAPSVQVYGHCVGSASLLMAMSSGATSAVRSAVCAQFPLHPVTSRLNRVKAGLRVGPSLRHLGTRLIPPDTLLAARDIALDLALTAVPLPRREHCGQAVCRWINAIYGATHSHAQLNEATHEALNTMFGVGNMTSLNHLARMMRRGLAVTSDGADVYTAHPERLRIPISFLQGTENYIFRPEGTRRTLRWLTDANGPGFYSRHLLPGYAHLDAVVGRDAARDVYPLILSHLEPTA